MRQFKTSARRRACAWQARRLSSRFCRRFKKGYDENVHLIEVRTTQLISLLESFATPFKNLDESVERALTDLAVKIAKQILHREIELDSGKSPLQ